jgi:mannose-6-phosphate isomerase-like protein (cupin superfamily)
VAADGEADGRLFHKPASVEEIWYFTAGHGRLWRQLGEAEEITEIGPGVSISILTGTHFQYRCDGAEPLVAVVKMPPWPGAGEAYAVDGIWQPTRASEGISQQTVVNELRVEAVS